MNTSTLRYSLALALLVAAPAFAQTSLTVPSTNGLAPYTEYALRGGLQITQSASTTVEGGGVACAATDAPSGLTFTTANSYLRVFDLAAESLAQGITLTSVDVGIGRARLDSVAAGFVDTQVIFYRMAPGTPFTNSFPRSSLTQVGSTMLRVFPIELPGTVVNAPITTPVSFGPTDLMVVEWFVPDGTAPQDPNGFENGFDIRYGRNDEGQAGNTYLSTNFNDGTACGGLPPTATQVLGATFGDLHWVLVVNANLGVAAEGGAPGRTIRLGDARPNPSTGASVIPFSLEAAGAARVSVYDVLGREVAVLTDREFTAGEHEVRLAEGILAPGAYVVRLVTPGGTLAQRLMVTR